MICSGQTNFVVKVQYTYKYIFYWYKVHRIYIVIGCHWHILIYIIMLILVYINTGCTILQTTYISGMMYNLVVLKKERLYLSSATPKLVDTDDDMPTSCYIHMGFLQWGYPHSWMVYMGNPTKNR